MEYFKNCRTPEELKARYKEWCKKLHPDNGGNADAFKEMMNEYKSFKFTYEYKHQNTDASDEDISKFSEIIKNIIHLDVSIEIVGSWVWVGGNTYPYRTELKENNFKFSKKWGKWYYSTIQKKKRGTKYKVEDIKAKYGCKEIKQSTTYKIA